MHQLHKCPIPHLTSIVQVASMRILAAKRLSTQVLQCTWSNYDCELRRKPLQNAQGNCSNSPEKAK